ncbi:MAG: ABC transporter ATP-binding protein [Thermodesulfobacteriota bacterium]
MDINRSDSLLQAKDLCVMKEGKTILNIPFFSVKKGESLALIGPNGAGKTTLLQTLSFLLNPFQGEVFFKGKKIEKHQSILEYRRKLALVFQESYLFDTTVFNNVASGLKIRGLGRKVIEMRVMENLRRFGILHLKDRSAKSLSGGEAKRVSLARAFAVQPELLLLDEPFTSLDPTIRESLIEDLDQILKQTHTTMILTTHDRLEALRLSHRIAIMKDGEILQVGSPEEVVNQPINELVASFVGTETIITGRVIRTGEGTIIVLVGAQEIEAVGEALLGEEVILCIRPESVTLSILPMKETISARNLFFGRIEEIIPMGFYQKVRLNCGFPLVAYVTRPSMEHLSLDIGKELCASFKATSIHVIRKTRRS